MRTIILDTETTGLEAAAGHRLVEIGALELIDRQLTGRQLHHYLNPERDSDPGALEVHGLTTDFLSDKPLFGHVAHELIEFVRGATVLIHNAPFDVGFINAELARLDLPELGAVCQIEDTLAMAKRQFPGKRNSLDALCDRLGVSNSHRVLHGALLDAEILAEVYLAMTRGQETLGMDIDPQHDHTGSAAFDVRQLDLVGIEVDEVDAAAHEAYLGLLAKKCADGAVWGAQG